MEVVVVVVVVDGGGRDDDGDGDDDHASAGVAAGAAHMLGAGERCRCSPSFNLASFTHLHLHPGSSGRAEVRFLFDDFQQCAVYNGVLSGPDSVYASVPHLGIVAESWRGNVTVAGL
jgi:hypothetical protein